MGISGYEAAIIAYMSPLLLAIPTLKTAVAKYPRLFHFLSLSGLLAYKVQNPTNRLFVTTFSVACNALTWSGIFHAEKTQSSRLESRILAWGIGLIMSSVAKFACSTNNPVWPTMHAENGGWNKMGLLLGILAVLRSHRKPVPSGGDYFPSTGKKGPSLLAAFGMGGLLFAMHSLLSDSSTMISWVWEDIR